jgi:hypothetical protein
VPTLPAIVVTANAAVRLALAASGLFFLVGLLTGVWKYCAIAAAEDARAPVYVDIAHRASLLYAFAALLLAQFAALSVWPTAVNFWATLAPLLFFAAAIAGYALHGLLRDTDNQFERPHRLGRVTLPSALLAAFMWTLIAAELGGAAVLVSGMVLRLYGGAAP